MYIKCPAASFAFKVFIVLSVLAGLLFTLGVFEGEFNPVSFKAYTLLSNIFVACFMVPAAFAALKGSADFKPMFRLIITVAILLTCLVAHFMLRQFLDPADPGGFWGQIFLHYIAPIATLLDYLLFAKKGLFRWYYAVAGLYPACIYSLMVMVMVTLGINWGFGFNAATGYASRFPYPFMDVDLYGTTQVTITILLLAAGVLVMGFLIVGLDALLGKAAAKRLGAPA